MPTRIKPLDDVRIGSIGKIPALFNEDNLIAVFGLFDSNTPRPFDERSIEAGGLQDYSRMLQNSVDKFLA